MPSTAPASTPISSGPGRATALPRDPGRATEVLYVRHGDRVFRYAWHLLGRREDAEDATQATFLAVHRALASGTAVLEPGAWVLGIARNECMGRLRHTQRRRATDVLDDEAVPAAEGSVESTAAVRDEMRIAQQTLRVLPEQEREAFVLREWLGLQTAEVALALGISTGDVEGLAARARRSLVLAVGGLEAPVGCAATRAALETGTLGRAGKVHLLRCPVCRGVRRALRPRDGVPGSVSTVAERLAGVLPGFSAGGGGIIAALAAKATAAPILTKAAVLVAATLLAGGAVDQAIRISHPVHIRSAAPPEGRGGQAAPLPAVTTTAKHAALIFVAPTAPLRHARTTSGTSASLALSTSRGGAAERGGDSGAGRRESGHDGSASSGKGDGRVGSSGSDGKDGSTAHTDDGGSRATLTARSSGSDDGSAKAAITSRGTGDGTRSSGTGSSDAGATASAPATSSGSSGDGGDATAAQGQDGGSGTSGDTGQSSTSGESGGSGPVSGGTPPATVSTGSN